MVPVGAGKTRRMKAMGRPPKAGAQYVIRIWGQKAMKLGGRKRMHDLTQWYAKDGSWVATWEPRLLVGGTKKTPLKILTAYRLHLHASYDASPKGVVDKIDIFPNIFHCFPPFTGKRPPLNSFARMACGSKAEWVKAYGKQAQAGDVFPDCILPKRKDTYSWDDDTSSFKLLKESNEPKLAKEKNPKEKKSQIKPKVKKPNKPKEKEMRPIKRRQVAEPVSSHSEPEPESPVLAARPVTRLLEDTPPRQAASVPRPALPEQPPQARVAPVDVGQGPAVTKDDRDKILVTYMESRTDPAQAGALDPQIAMFRGQLAGLPMAVIQDNPHARSMTGTQMLELMNAASIFMPQDS